MISISKAGSFLEYLESNQNAAHYCQSLGLYSDEDETNGYEESECEEYFMNVAEVLNKISSNNGLEILNYRGPERPFPDSIFLIIQEKIAPTLEGLYVNLHRMNLSNILNCKFTHLTCLHLYLDSTATDHDDLPGFNPGAALISFLNQHLALQVLRLSLPDDFTDLDFSSITLSDLYSFLLYSENGNIQVRTFLQKHRQLRRLDCEIDTDIEPFDAQDLPNIRALSVDTRNIHQYMNMLLASNTVRETPLIYLQIRLFSEEAVGFFSDRDFGIIGRSLRCLEIISDNETIHVKEDLGTISEIFPQLKEVIILIYDILSPGVKARDYASHGLSEFKDALESFANYKYLEALSFSKLLECDPSEMLLRDVLKSTPFPQKLKYISWNSMTFRIGRLEDDVFVERIVHPSMTRCDRWIVDWTQEAIFDHMKEDFHEK